MTFYSYFHPKIETIFELIVELEIQSINSSPSPTYHIKRKRGMKNNFSELLQKKSNQIAYNFLNQNETLQHTRKVS